MSGYNKECVILVHGLARTSRSFSAMNNALAKTGYHVVNVDYPSRKHSIEKLAHRYITRAVDQCAQLQPEKVHFVTHSMGAILVRYYLARQTRKIAGNVVMPSPPNKGSEVVDKLGNLPGFLAINGPAGQQLGTSDTSLPNTLGAVKYPVGIITGNKSINLILSALIPGEDDGKVSVERAKLDGMADFLVVPHTHPMIMRSNTVIYQTRHFLRNGNFQHKDMSQSGNQP